MSKRTLNIALAIIGVIVIVAFAVAARSGGSSAETGNAKACNAYWNWYDSTGSSTPVYTAYQEATTQPLEEDLQALSEGLKGNTNINTNNASNAVAGDCTNLGYSDPET